VLTFPFRLEHSTMSQEIPVAPQQNSTPDTPTVVKVPQEKPVSILSPTGMASILALPHRSQEKHRGKRRSGKEKVSDTMKGDLG
jgi:hypothetical protein